MTVSASRPKPAGDLLMSVAEGGTITAAQILKLRWEVFGDGVVDRAEAEALFDLNDACALKNAAWNDFFVDSLTDYFVWRQKPRGYLGDEACRFLIDRVTHKDPDRGRIDGPTEMELLVNIVHWAREVPEDLLVMVLSAVKETVLNGGGPLFGPKRQRSGVIDRADVEIIRRLVYAGGGGGGHTITRREADLLFDLNDATTTGDNADTWQELFVKAIASHVMFPRGAPKIPTAREAQRREAWQNDRRGVGRLLGDMAGEVLKCNIAKNWTAADIFGTRAKRAAIESERGQRSDAERREAIDGAEATWLIERIGGDEILHGNERALLTFIHEHAPAVHPTLIPLMERAGLKSA